MIRLLDACVQALQQQGMNKMFVDAVKGDHEGYQSIGRYRPLTETFVTEGCLLMPSRLPKMGNIQRCVARSMIKHTARLVATRQLENGD